MKKSKLYIKILILLAFCLCTYGCTTNKNDPHATLLEIIENDYPDSTTICEKKEDQYYLALLKDKENITLIILDNENGYNYFGGSYYDFSKQSYGTCIINNIVIVFSENNDKYSKITLDYTNVSNDNETINVNTYVNADGYILNMYIFPSKYNILKINLE